MALMFGLVVLLIAVALTLLRTRVAASSPTHEIDFTSLAARYRPMSRLLDEADFDTLNTIGDVRVVRRMRAQRRAIFRGYLKCLRRDHGLICSRVRTLMVESQTDRKDLATTLFRAEVTFQWLIVAVNFRLMIHATGVGRVDVAGLLKSFEQVRGQFESLSMAMPMSVAA